MKRLMLVAVIAATALPTLLSRDFGDTILNSSVLTSVPVLQPRELQATSTYPSLGYLRSPS